MSDWLTKLFKKTPPVVAPTLEQRHANANRAGARAVNLFTVAVNDLETAAGELESLSSEATELARQYSAHAEATAADAATHRYQADKIKSLLA